MDLTSLIGQALPWRRAPARRRFFVCNFESVLTLGHKASWVEPKIGPNDDCFDGYPELSIEDWHKKHGLWIE